jgi:hypothetical protein
LPLVPPSLLAGAVLVACSGAKTTVTMTIGGNDIGNPTT